MKVNIHKRRKVIVEKVENNSNLPINWNLKKKLGESSNKLEVGFGRKQ